MALTAVAVRQASIVDGGKFKAWVMANLDGEESQAQANVKLADLSYEMPELAVAGSGGGDDNDAPADNPLIDSPAEPEGSNDSGHRDKAREDVAGL